MTFEPPMRFFPLIRDYFETLQNIEAGNLHDSTSKKMTVEPIAGDGSSRRIYRGICGENRVVIVENRLEPGISHPDENERFLAVWAYLARSGIRVPEVHLADLENGIFLLEDLGDRRLFDLVRAVGWANCNSDTQTEPFYEVAVQMLVRMQKSRCVEFRPESVGNPPYTEEYILTSEAGYFHREFVHSFAGLDHDFGEIEPECRRLAQRAVSSGTKSLVFMHRDFQSRNLMAVGTDLVVVDFQGARLGPPEYDLAALLYDPYIAMPVDLRDQLILAYLRTAAEAEVPGLPATRTADWDGRFRASAANRLMQALGAFAKLGVRDHRKGFLEHAPTALRHLEEVLVSDRESQRLLKLVRRLRQISPCDD